MSGLLDTIERKYFERDALRKAIVAILASIGLNILMVIALVITVLNTPDPKYFATNLKGGLIQLHPLNEPVVTQAGLLNWVVQSTTALYTYDFVNYRKQLNATEVYFSGDGFSKFTEQLKKSGVLDTVISSRMVVSAVPTGTPIVEAEGPLRGIYTWRVKIPIKVSYQSANEQATRDKMITLTIQRASTHEKDYGIAISQIIEG